MQQQRLEEKDTSTSLSRGVPSLEDLPTGANALEVHGNRKSANAAAALVRPLWCYFLLAAEHGLEVVEAAASVSQS